MVGFIGRLMGKRDSAFDDAKVIYSKLMIQSRSSEFYGAGKVPDNYDGRIDFLTLHISGVMEVLQKHGEQGKLLSQAIYDVMKDDFEISMREEGLSDAGIKRRIKPMMQLFFTRIKSYVEGLQGKSDLEAAFKNGLLKDSNDDFQAYLSSYLTDFHKSLSVKTLGELALGKFTFPK